MGLVRYLWVIRQMRRKMRNEERALCEEWAWRKEQRIKEDEERTNKERAHKTCMMEEKRKKEAKETREKEKTHEEDERLRQTFKEKKKNVKSLTETKTKLAKIQTSKKKKQEKLTGLSEQVDSVAARCKVAKHEKVDCMDVVVEELNREIEGMSPLEPRLRPKEPRLVSTQLPKKSKSKAWTSRPEDVQRGNC
ncbi:hypothetical protein E6C27_scaffold428G00710 [Cucumis melo var. makuwa]|uniref:Uncharacterized protein n=2 Tax=Cucumis melo TaxID=3656 RepID=A0A5A7UBY9_CUCMM|nr:uncharacterized protein LOC127150379 [Cucumis melo]KAA0053403.1 hypothetical protein E6C27_scaffold428G00710 [Cucumis melo var. makuwa]